MKVSSKLANASDKQMYFLYANGPMAWRSAGKTPFNGMPTYLNLDKERKDSLSHFCPQPLLYRDAQKGNPKAPDCLVVWTPLQQESD